MCTIRCCGYCDFLSDGKRFCILNESLPALNYHPRFRTFSARVATIKGAMFVMLQYMDVVHYNGVTVLPQLVKAFTDFLAQQHSDAFNHLQLLYTCQIEVI